MCIPGRLGSATNLDRAKLQPVLGTEFQSFSESRERRRKCRDSGEAWRRYNGTAKNGRRDATRSRRGRADERRNATRTRLTRRRWDDGEPAREKRRQRGG
ncbi:hypothetical protein PIB30_011279 [Stylosanthes scabra]|uniref:Uncharacterized protein n=1 Tax=Stylosanthes scabra TaxID=79078 RepID=A0ABU6V443_9FABA|nr:hypothetical protein [Stylosanthes scabra]